MALMNVGGNFQLNTPAGLAYLRARSAGLPPGITTATRSYDLQMTWYKNQGNPATQSGRIIRTDRSTYIAQTILKIKAVEPWTYLLVGRENG